jgi:hypothetical protein
MSIPPIKSTVKILLPSKLDQKKDVLLLNVFHVPHNVPPVVVLLTAVYNVEVLEMILQHVNAQVVFSLMNNTNVSNVLSNVKLVKVKLLNVLLVLIHH